ncbi:replication-relaxation family protein [Actinomadura scrupuli]|uniref:replication-relaxation family protein n=1 Tax=Actinomadura scrupuli TaxID=559629 RepID=UPI003D98CED6
MTRTAKTTKNRMRRIRGTRPRVSPELIADLAHRLTGRDRAVLELVWEHRVLTTHQITEIVFHNPHKARHRLLELKQLSALARFQPWAPVGSEPMHWVLGPAGAHILAAQRGIDVTELGYRHDTTLAISHSVKLAHQVGVNDFFAKLHAYARRRSDDAAVTQWWPERRCAALWADLARPDAYGRWAEPTPDGRLAEVDFFLEHDTGSETLSLVAGKLSGYAALAEATGISTPVLFWLPSQAREINLRKVVGIPEVPVATAVQTPGTALEGPAGCVWLPLGSTGPRRRLIDLVDAWPSAGPRLHGPDHTKAR